jgi:hypothetical protein
MTRATGYPVKTINTDMLLNGLTDYGYLKDGAVVSPLAVVQTEDGIVTICTEGVGWKLNDIGEATIEIYYDGIFQYPDVPLVFVLGALSGGTEVELADFIRVFGDRLERNFSIWKNQIDGVPQQFDMEVANVS